MKAEDTVMNDEQIAEIVSVGNQIEDINREPAHIERAIAKAQAEISFKAGMKQGIWLFAWWKDGVQYVGTTGRTLKEALKEVE